MSKENQLLEEIKKYDTPSVTNIIATYPKNPLCLGLYNPWTQNWYTDQSIHCMFPELGRTVGYAVTCVFGLPDQGYSRLKFTDVIDAVSQSKKPAILVAKHIFPPEIAGKVGLFGAIMTTALKSIGCIGVISDGPSRDIEDIRTMSFQYMLTGLAAGHGEFSVHAVNTAVSVAGMDVIPGEIIHMDENGACKFPADKLEAVVNNLKILIKEEEELISGLSRAKTVSQIKDFFNSRMEKSIEKSDY
jgi:regulator of RNase E activity RraA